MVEQLRIDRICADGISRSGGLALLALVPALDCVPLPQDEAHEYDRAPQQNIFS